MAEILTPFPRALRDQSMRKIREADTPAFTTLQTVRSPCSQLLHQWRNPHSTRTTGGGVGSRRWSWLHLVSFAAFAALLLALLIALIVVDHFANAYDGFEINSSTSPYTWKYGPTAVLAIVIALWRQFDYRLKLEAPWLQMQSQPSPASKTVLLDYLSPIWPITFVKSLRNNHWRVSLGLMVLFMLQVVVLFSTALMLAQDTSFTQPGISLALDNDVNRTIEAINSDDLVVAYYGMVAKGLVPPLRTTATAAYQIAVPAGDIPEKAIITADVLGFFPSLDCESATETHQTETSNGTDDGIHMITTTSILFTFESNSCTTSLTSLTALDSCDSAATKCDPRQLIAEASGVNCPNYGGGPDAANTLLILLMEVQNSPNGTQTYGKNTAMLCRARYSIEQAKLTIDPAQRNGFDYTQLSSPLTQTGQQLPGFTPDHLMSDVTSMAAAADSYLPQASLNSANASGTPTINDYFNLMLLVGSVSDPTDLFNASLMSDLGERVFQGLAGQWVGAAVPLGNDSTTTGTYSWTSTRLHVSQFSFVAICTLLSMAALLIIILSISSRGTPDLPDDLAFQISILRQSSNFRHLLQGLGHASNDQLKSRLNSLFSTAEAEHAIRVEVTGDKEASDVDLSSEPVFWRPMAVRYLFAVLTVAVPVTLIVILEILQRLSDANDGLGDVWISRSAAQQISSYLSAAIMLTLAACSSSAKFNFIIFSPYHTMMTGAATFQQAQFTALGSLAPVALYKSLLRKQFSVATAMVSAILGSTLTIIVSGLYTVDTVPNLHLTTATTADHFNLSWNERGDLSGGTMFTLVEHHNSSFPNGTYNEIAYNLFNLGLDAQTLVQLYGSSQIEVDMPIIRPSLNCSVVPKGSVSVNVTDKLSEDIAGEGEEQLLGWYANVTVVTDLPEQCKNSSASYHDSTQLFVLTYPNMPVPSQGYTFGGQLSVPETQNGSSDLSYQLVSGPDCPGLAFQFGRYVSGQTSNYNTTVLLCSQYQESVLATLTFSLPGLELNTTQPPLLQEQTAQIVSRTQYDLDNLFGFRLESTPTDSGSADSFMDTVLHGTEGIPGDELVGPGNEKQLYDAVQHVYRKFMVQVISDAARVPGAASAHGDGNSRHQAAPAGTLQARVDDPNRLRLVQQNTSKIMLQAVLGAMVVCSLISYGSIRRMRRLLHHNPCSIAGSMSLLAGSHLVNDIAPDGDGERGNTTERERLLTGRGRSSGRLQLRWWEWDSGEKRYGIDVI